jgi:hypothetical protein
MPKLMQQWRQGLQRLGKQLQAKEQQDALLWPKIFILLALAFFFAGWHLGSTIEYNHCVSQVERIFDGLQPEQRHIVVMDNNTQDILRKFNLVNVTEYPQP